MPDDRVPGYTRPIPRPPALPQRRPTPGVVELTRQAAKRVMTPPPGYRSLTPPAQPQDRLEDMERTPAATPASIDAREHEQLRREQDGIEARAKLYTDAKLEEMQRESATSLKLKLAIGTGIVAAFGAIASAAVNWVGAERDAKTGAATDLKVTSALQDIRRDLSEIKAEQRAIRTEWRDDRSDLLRRIASRPLNKDPDLVSAVRRGTTAADERTSSPDNPYGL